ncbi:MAG: DUF4783 domain-containing protein [Ferruginibacter sp.]
MKKILTLFVVAIILTSFTSFTGIDEIITGLKSGNAAQVSKYFDNTVEVTLPEKSNSYSKSQADLVLRDFFTTNSVKGFEVIHKGENAGSQYCIGTLIAKNNSYRTTIFMKQKGDKQTLQEIRIENR